jgi:LysM repeat protein
MRALTWVVAVLLVLLSFAMLGAVVIIVTERSAYALPPTPVRRAAAMPTFPLPQPVESLPTATATRVIPVAVVDQVNPGLGRKMHIVQPGQSLMAIANGYGVSQQAILQMNNLLSADSVASGFTLLIPGPNDFAPSPTPADTSTPTPRPTRRPRPPTATPTSTLTPLPSPMPVVIATTAPVAAAAAPQGKCDKVGADGKCKCRVMKGGRCKHEH